MEIQRNTIWLKKAFKFVTQNIFKTQYRNLLCNLIFYAQKKDLNHSSINSIAKSFNLLSHRTKFHYVEVCEITSNAPEFVTSTQNVLHSAKPQYYHQNFSLSEVKKQCSFILKLANVEIIGSSNIVLINSGEAIYEPFFYDEENRWDYTDTGILKNRGQSFILKYGNRKNIIPCGIMLSGNYSWNYYHFIFEFLSKFLLVNELNIPNDVPLIVDDIVKDVPQYNELLNYFNCVNREIIFIKKGYCYDVGTLYYPSLLNVIAPNLIHIDNIRFSDCLFNLSSINFLRDTLKPKMAATNCKKRIFLSRRNASSRRNYNESEVVTIFEKYDFQIVCPEDFGIAEQIYLFNNADFIAGATGGAFTNILFCNPGCKILCITSFQIELSVFSTIAKHLELDLQYLSAHDKQYKTQWLHKEFEIDPVLVEETLIDFLKK